MHGFVSHYTNKVDAKGRVSIPASFRAVLTRDGFDGLYCFPSPHVDAVDAGGYALLSQISARLGGLEALTVDHDLMSTALFGVSEILKVDAEGRVILSETIRDITGVTNAVTFAGLDYKFQIWEPERFKVHSAEAMRRAFGTLRGSASREEAG
ncbi:MAG: division/cell wall cluster transcriptional repressor MraZ [Pseudomonadota bacterium]